MLIEFIWRRKHHGDIMVGITKALREISFDRCASNPAWYTEYFDAEEWTDEEDQNSGENYDFDELPIDNNQCTSSEAFSSDDLYSQSSEDELSD